jgi:hypothetical protein
MFQSVYRERFHSVASISRELTQAVEELERLREILRECHAAQNLQQVHALTRLALYVRERS